MSEIIYSDSPYLLILSVIALALSCYFPTMLGSRMAVHHIPRPVRRLILINIIWNLGSVIGILFFNGTHEVGTPTYIGRQILFGIQMLFWIRTGNECYSIGEEVAFSRHNKIRILLNGIGSFVVVTFTILLAIAPEAVTRINFLGFTPFSERPIFNSAILIYLLFLLPGYLATIFQLCKNGMHSINKAAAQTSSYMAASFAIFIAVAFAFDIIIPLLSGVLSSDSETQIGTSQILIWNQFMAMFLTLLCGQYYTSVSYKNKSSYWLLNKLISRMEEGIIYFDDNGQIVHANQGAAKLLGISSTNMKGKSIKSVFPPSLEFFRETVYNDIRITIGGEIHSFKIHFFRNSQTLTTVLNIAFFVDQSKTLLLQQNLKTLNDQYVEYTHDLVRYQDRLNKEASIKAEKENVLNTLINALPFRVWYKNEQGVYQKQNQQDIEKNGAREGASDDPQLISSFERDARDLGEVRVHPSIEDKDGKEITQDEANTLAKNGDVYGFFDNMYIPIIQGKPPYKTLCIKVDMTEQRRLEQERNMLREQKFIHSRLEELGTMCGASAHDYNNILGSQIGFCQLAQEMLPEGHQASMFIAEALKAAQRGKTSLEELLNAIRGNANAATPAMVFSPYMIIEDVVKKVALTLPPTIVINSQDLDHSLKIKGIVASLDRIISNLANNAIFAMKKTGGTLTFKLHEQVLEKELITPYAPPVPAGHYAQMDISDTGSGMDSGTLERIFAPFFTTKAPGEGLGLGLSSALRLLKEGNAYFTVHTTLGKGTTFNLYWPLNTETETETKKED